MGLKLRLRPFERVIINGCVVTNGDRRNTMTISSFGQVVKSRDILQEEDAVTPTQKLYFVIQSLLIDSSAIDELLPKVHRAAGAVFALAPDDEARASLLTAIDWVHRGDYYKALSELRPHIRGNGGKAGDAPDFDEPSVETRQSDLESAAVA